MRRLLGADSLRSDNRCSLGTAAHGAADVARWREVSVNHRADPLG